MKYNIILTNNEVEVILNLKFNNLEEAIEKLQKDFKDFDIKNSKKSQYILNNVLGIRGNLKYNVKDLKCPNCNGKYIARTYAGDLYYRLFNATRAQKKTKRQELKKGLYSNPWVCSDYYTRDYLCLNCGVRWDNQYKNIYRDIEEIKM